MPDERRCISRVALKSQSLRSFGIVEMPLTTPAVGQSKSMYLQEHSKYPVTLPIK